MKKLCFLSGYFNNYSLKSKSQGGAEYQNHLLKCELEEQGYSIFFISVGDRNEVRRDGKTIIIYLKKKPTRIFGKDFFLYCFSLLYILKRINPHIVYQRCSIGWTGIGAWYAKKNKKKFIWAVASDEDVSPFKFEKISNLLFNFIDFKVAQYGKLNSTVTIVQTEIQKTLLLQNYGVKANEVISNYHPLPKTLVSKNSKQIQIIWVANFSENKQPELFIKIAEHLRDIEFVKFIMIGRPYNSPKQKHLEFEMQELGNIEYLGPLKQDDVNLHIGHSQILVNTSLVEGFANVYIQAWMRGTVVVSLHSDPDGVLSKHNFGYCSNGDLKNLSDFIRALVNDLGNIETMGKSASEHGIKHHSIESQIDKIVKYF